LCAPAPHAAICIGARARAAYAVATIAVAFFVGACAQTPTRAQTETRPAPPPVNLSGYSAAFKEGFAEGCDTARGSARRDEKRFGADAQYAQGWQDGKAICGKR
jgi:hypothetical protein